MNLVEMNEIDRELLKQYDEAFKAAAGEWGNMLQQYPSTFPTFAEWKAQEMNGKLEAVEAAIDALIDVEHAIPGSNELTAMLRRLNSEASDLRCNIAMVEGEERAK